MPRERWRHRKFCARRSLARRRAGCSISLLTLGSLDYVQQACYTACCTSGFLFSGWRCGVIISVVNQKGGTGKTTVATNLAACFAGDGSEVLVIDADPQQSSLDWRADRPEDQPPVQAVGLPARNLHQEIEPFRRKYDVILIDGGG